MQLTVLSTVHRRCRRHWSTLVLSSLCALFAAGLVNDGHAQSDAETEEARQRFQEGVRFYDQKQYEKARSAFAQAYSLKPHPAVLLNLAQSELRAGRHADAATHFAKYIRENPNADALDHARSGFEEARKRVVEVNVAVNHPDAVVTVDGVEAGRSPLPDVLYIDPGSHTIGAEKEGATATQVLRADAGQRLYVTLELQGAWADAPQTTEPTAPPLAATPAAAVATDAEPEGRGFFEWLGRTPEAIATVTVGGLALGTSAILAAFASKRYNDAEEVKDLIMVQLRQDISDNIILEPAVPCGPGGIANGAVNFDNRTPELLRDERILEYARACDSFSQRADSGDRLKTFAFVALTVGAAATLATVVWYFTDTSGSSPTDRDSASPGSGPTDDGPRATLLPVLARETQGLWLNVSF